MQVFSKNMIFGIAESDLQTVGTTDVQQIENARRPMWDVFAEKRGIDRPQNGTEKYVHWKEDIQALSSLGVGAFRTSISMSRTIGKDGKPNSAALKWYRDYFTSLKSRGITLHLCLYHWEAPEQFSDLGILDPSFHSYFRKHIRVVIENFSDLIDYYIPINELWCVAYLSYLLGIHAPGFTSLDMFFKAYVASISLQADAIRFIKQLHPKAKIGLVNIHFPSYVQQHHASEQTYQTARHIADHITNFIYSDPFFIGSIDEHIVRRFKKNIPRGYKTILKNADVHDSIDYYGVNYYNSQFIQPSQSNPLGFEWITPRSALTNSLGWPISLPPTYPDGLTDFLETLWKRYRSFGLKNLYVSENGTPAITKKVKGKRIDRDRIFFLSEHLRQVHNAIELGVPVRGYFLWTLVDNYEWQEGYKREGNFGLMAVDSKTGKRLPKASFMWYKQFLKSYNYAKS